MRVDVGAGYRIYYGRDGQELVILLCGGDKSSQQADIKQAIQYVAIAKGGIAKLAEITGLNRESLYKTLSEQGNPHYDTLSMIVHGLGFRFAILLNHENTHAA